MASPFAQQPNDFLPPQQQYGEYVHHRAGAQGGPQPGSMMMQAQSWGLDEEDYSNEPPLLEELGINFEHIWRKVYAVLILQRDIGAC